jgi:hypothetical protein
MMRRSGRPRNSTTTDYAAMQLANDEYDDSMMEGEPSSSSINDASFSTTNDNNKQGIEYKWVYNQLVLIACAQERRIVHLPPTVVVVVVEGR